MAVGVALHLVDIGIRCSHGLNPISSTPEAMSLVAFLIAAGYLVATLRYQLAAAGAFAVPAALVVLLLRGGPRGSGDTASGPSAARTSFWPRWG